MDYTQILAAIGAQVAQEIHVENPAANRYVSVIGRLMAHASKWSAVSAAGIKCTLTLSGSAGERVRCREGAIASCVVCEKPACFNHSMLSPRDGTVICFACVGSAQAHVREHGAPSSPGYGAQCSCQDAWRCDPKCPAHGTAGSKMERSDHLRTLGLDDGAGLEEIKAAYKELARKNHPDKVKGPRKASAQKRMAEINTAYEWLTNKNKRAA